jgi:hypothetical protein
MAASACKTTLLLQLPVLGFGLLQSQNQRGLRRFRDGERRAAFVVTNL